MAIDQYGQYSQFPPKRTAQFSDYRHRQNQNKLKALELEEGEREVQESKQLVTSLMALVALRKQFQRFRWLAIVFILTGLSSPLRAEWILRHDVAENVYSASSDAVSVELYRGKDVPTETKTYVSVAFSCHPSNPTGGILIIFKEAVVFDSSKPMRAELGYKVYGKPFRIGDPVKSYKTPVRSDKEFPRIVAVSSGFRKDFLQYLKSAHDDRKHVLALYFELKPKQIAFTENISLANAKVSIRAAQKMCE